ncbi:hypothetical protein [Paracoccus marcusii]|uniref:hypothetical protein n=1 Tax=Paracoccus marcusii TaxID=59779 RepID=UPI0039C86049
MPKAEYEPQMAALQMQLVRMMHDVIDSGKRLVVLFEGATPPARAARSSVCAKT